jgi:poly(A) polymerase
VTPAGRIEPPPPWMTAPETRAVLAALGAGGATVRFVGGCVRDAVLHRPGRDVDIATPEPPDLVLRRLAEAGIHAIPTGIEHGTVTAVIGTRHFEITSLRTDVETYGRRAKVAYTDDWAADAARRDFTINALFADPDGTLYDPVGGLADLAAGRVRFVGRADERIREDALRILRFFRFHARYNRGAPDGEAVAACRAGAKSLRILSGERVAGELLRLLETPDPTPSIALMDELGVLAEALPAAPQGVARLRRLVALEGQHAAPDSLRRLAALLPADADAMHAVADRLRLSNRERERLVGLADGRRQVQPGLSAKEMRRLVYRMGSERFRDVVLIAWAEGRVDDGAPLLALAASSPPPAFPLRGADALALGVPHGKQVGDLLRAVERWWEEGDYRASREACLDELRRRAGA